MNRRSFLSMASVTTSGLDPYSGPWNYELAAHLLRRTTFGPTNERILNALEKGMSTTISELMNPGAMPTPPINYYYNDDPEVPIGETWVDKKYTAGADFNGQRTSRRRSLRAWTTMLMYEEGNSIREKLTLFWHNHFVTANINEPKFQYDYINRIRTNALGNFRAFVKQMTIDPSMLRYLNGNQNTRVAPNENYARELLELFTIGKGPAVGPGDYTNYTEDDVVEMAKILTGWRTSGLRDTESTVLTSYFTLNRHDTSDKKLSHRFDEVVISNAGDLEYANLIDIIFQKDEVAYFICRKLYRWFVFSEINEDVELNVIDPMAKLLIANDYEIAPVVEALISSEHFFDEANRGCLIKNPWDFVIGMLKELQFNIPASNVQAYYTTFLRIFTVPAGLQMEYYNPPNVAGWSAYYQEPSFYQLWTNAVTLPQRVNQATILMTSGIQVPGNNDVNGFRAEVAFLDILNAFENPGQVNSVIDQFVRMLFPKDISQNQKDYLKEILIPGLPDFEWNLEYSDYANDPSNEDNANAIKNKIRNLLTAMLNMPEYHLS